MRGYPIPGPGSVVTFPRQAGGPASPTARGVVAGCPVLDPFTGAAWLPVRVSMAELVVIRADSLVNVTSASGESSGESHRPAA